MVLYHKAPKTKAGGSGGFKRQAADKRLRHYGGFQAMTKLQKEGKEEHELTRTKGGSFKVKGKHVSFANVIVSGKAKKVKILNVVETPSNRHYARENVMVKGAIIETEAGKAIVTSRPGQSGVVNAVLTTKA